MKALTVSKRLIGCIVTLAGIAAAKAQTFTVLDQFNGPNGAEPNSGVIRESGSLYGTTTGGGNMTACGGLGCGTVFQMDRNGETVLYSFTGGADGGNPIGGVIRDAAGNLYGTTSAGGAGFGVVFKLDTGGVETVLHSFTGPDGEWPHTGVIRDAAGNLYGTSTYGGTFSEGVVYKLDASNTFSVLHNFTGGTDGGYPQGTVIRDASENLYGTTTFGGIGGSGVIFKLDTTGNETVLYTFTGGSDGKNPYAGVTHDKAGNLYGTTQGGGDTSAGYGYGVVYKLDTGLHLTVLYTFEGQADGGDPAAGVVLDATGNIYGTTLAGGNLACSIYNSAGCGVIFKLDPSGTETVLHTFSGMGADGGYNQANLSQDAAGVLFGTSAYAAGSGLGEIFGLTP